MSDTRINIPGLVFVMMALAVAFAAPTSAAPVAQEKGGGKDEPVVDKKIGKKMAKALELMNTDKYAEAREILEDLATRRFISPYERARIENLLTYVAQGQRKYGEAREHIQKAIDSGGLNDQEIVSSRFQLAQLFLVEERWKEGIAAINQWMSSPGVTPTANAFYMLAVANYQLKKYEAALEPAQKAVSMTEKPQESWLQLLLALRLEREQYRDALPILLRMIQMAPAKGNYWIQLSNVYSMLSKYDEALAGLQIAYSGGFANDQAAIRRLVDLALHANIPIRAGRILQKAIEQKKVSPETRDWEKLGISWIAAREFEKAVEPLTQAASMAENGELYVRVAELHIEREDWNKAVKALKQANDKGKLRTPADSQMLMGVALMNLKKYKEAKGYFQRAEENEKTRTQAVTWLRYLDTVSKGNAL